MELLKLYINILGMNELISHDCTVRMILFNGRCEGKYFNGTILPGGVDTQLIREGASGTLSARYMLEGYDSEGQLCHIYIENNADHGSPDTCPILHTDSPALKWLETETLAGRIENPDGQLVITIYRK